MVEGERSVPVPGIEDYGRPGVVGPYRIFRGPGQEDRGDRVEARVPRGVRVGAELADELDVERGLFAGLPDGGRFERLAVVDEAAGQRPAGGRVLPLDKDDAPHPAAVHDLDDDVDGGEGVPEFGAGHRDILSSAAIVGALSEGCQRNPWTRAQPENGDEKMGTFLLFSAKNRSVPNLQIRPPNHRGRPRSGTAPRRPAWSIRRTHWHEKC